MAEPSFGNLKTPDPRYSMHPPMNANMWQGRHIGDDGEFAAEVAHRLGGGAIVVQHGKFSFGVYQPRFEKMIVMREDGSGVTCVPEYHDGVWHIALELVSDKHGDDPPLLLTRGDLATLMSSVLPAAAHLLDTMRGGAVAAPRVRAGRSSRPQPRLDPRPETNA